jgi:hypothetical protein
VGDKVSAIPFKTFFQSWPNSLCEARFSAWGPVFHLEYGNPGDNCPKQPLCQELSSINSTVVVWWGKQKTVAQSNTMATSALYIKW